MMPCAGHTSPQGIILEGTCVMVDLSLRADIPLVRVGRLARAMKSQGGLVAGTWGFGGKCMRPQVSGTHDVRGEEPSLEVDVELPLPAFETPTCSCCMGVISGHGLYKGCELPLIE